MVRAILVSAAIGLCAVAVARAQAPTPAEGWVVIPVDEYRTLRLRAFPPETPPAPPPVDAAISRIDYDLRVEGSSATGEARITVDVLKDGWVRVDVPPGLLVSGARLNGRPVPLVDVPAPHVLLSSPGRATLALDVVLPVTSGPAGDVLLVPPSPGAVSRVSLAIPRSEIDLAISGGVLAERATSSGGRWVVYAGSGQPTRLTWKRRVDDVRATQPLRWRGSVTQIVGLGEETSPVNAAVQIDVMEGLAAAIDVAIPEGMTINAVSGALVADWDLRPGVLKVSFLEPVAGSAALSIAGEARLPREGTVSVPLLRLPAAEREAGGVAIEVLGAGEMRGDQARALDRADPADLGPPVAGRESPSMAAFRFRPQIGSAERGLAVTVARYTPQAVLVANVEEARYDALVSEEGNTLVRARYAVRNNQRTFLAVTLPPNTTLWSAAVAGRPLRPGIGPQGAFLLPLEKGRAGEEAPPFIVELTYVARTARWNDKGEAALTLPAIDLPISRTGVLLHHSPRFQVEPEPGAFRVEEDAGPPALAIAAHTALAPQPAPAPAGAEMDALVRQFRKDTAARTVAGLLPVHVPFPEFGPSVFLRSELTAELHAPSVEYSYKRESRW
jgi:hypothetical protein